MILSEGMEETELAGDSEESRGVNEVEQENEEKVDDGQLMTLSLNAISGYTGGKTIKLMGVLQGRTVLILIDCGATHSFISENLVEELHIPVDGRITFVVQVGDARNIRGKGFVPRCVFAGAGFGN